MNKNLITSISGMAISFSLMMYQSQCLKYLSNEICLIYRGSGIMLIGLVVTFIFAFALFTFSFPYDLESKQVITNG